MNKQQFEILKMLESVPADKANFLRSILHRAAQGYDYAVDADAQHIGGELRLTVVKEGQGTYYGKKNISTQEQSGGNLYTGIHHKFRERKTIADFDWSGYDKKTSLYNE